MFKSIKDVRKYIKDNYVEFVDFKIIDIKGQLRHLTIPAANLKENIMADGIGFDGSNYGFALVENSDMIFVPDLNTIMLEPFASYKTLTMMVNVYKIENNKNILFEQYPRSVIKNAIDYMKKLKVADEMIIGPEYEFHMIDSLSYKVSPTEMSYHLSASESEYSSDIDNNAYHTLAKDGYHIDKPSDITFDIRNEICEVMKECGIEVKYHHHEVGGSGQLEIETELTEVAKAADDTILTKYIIKNVANNNNMTATLMPKPIYGEAGNGMHVHMLLKKKGENIFYKKGTYCDLSKEAMYFMGGILKHISSICAFANPTTNSYKRLVPGFEAPVTIGYACANRSAVIRIPNYVKTKDKKRFELRNPDAMCNPYYTFAAILMAGLDGIKNKIDPNDYNWGPFDLNLYDLSEKEKAKLKHLPKSLDEALEELKKDHKYLLEGNVFTKELIENWIKAIEKESSDINKMPHPGEFKLYWNR